MAKTGFWLRNAKGKLAGATLYQQNGETVMREVVSPSNPKTERQMIQRVIMHTCMQAYSFMKNICDHSFEGMKKGQDTMAYFMQRNLQIARMKVSEVQQAGQTLYNAYNFSPLKMKMFAPNQYQVSMGSLPQVASTMMEEDTAAVYIPSIKTNTYQAVIDALGLQRGDQLTFIVIGTSTPSNYNSLQFHYCRVILDPTNADFTQAPLSTPFLDAQGHINLPSVRNEGNFFFKIDANDGLRFTKNGETIFAGTAIVSREVNGNWLRSTAYLNYNGGEIYSLQECLDMAESGNATIYAPSSQYLNNAGQGGGVAAQQGSGSGDSGSGSGSGDSGGGTSTNPVTSASIGGQTMIAGTPKSIDSATAALVVNADATATEGKFLSVRAASSEFASAPFNSGVASISNKTWVEGTRYTLFITDENNENTINTNYSFEYSENGAGDQ